MDIPASNEMVSHLKEVLFLMVEDLAAYNKLQARLASAGAFNHSSPAGLRHCVNGVIAAYITDLEIQLTEAYSKGTSARITVDKNLCFPSKIDPEYERLHKQAEGSNIDDQQTFVLAALMRVDWDAIERSLRTQAEDLETKGLGLIADELIKQLGIQNQRFPVTATSRHVVCKIFAADYFSIYEKVRSLQELQKSLDVVSQHSGVSFGEAIDLHIDALKALHYEERRISSRTTFAKGKTLEIACFKEVYEYRFQKPAFDAIAAFIFMYGNENSIRYISEVIGETSNAA